MRMFSKRQEVISNRLLLKMDVIEDVIEQGCGEGGFSQRKVLLEGSLPEVIAPVIDDHPEVGPDGEWGELHLQCLDSVRHEDWA